MKRRNFFASLGAGLMGAFLPGRFPLPRLKRERFVERWSWAMGQAVHLMVYAESEDQGLEACAKALGGLRRGESIISVFDDASELSELNRRAGKRPLRASPDLTYALNMADGFRRFTNGAFNAAVEPLMRLWGFHHPRQSFPSATEIAAARQSVATASLVFSNQVLSLPNSHTRLDLGGMGVGLGIDLMSRLFWEAGIRRAFIDISGDCYGLGAPPDQPEGWPVKIAGSNKVLHLRNQALATSSNVASVIELQGRVVGHIMDPETGAPVDSRRQATVVAALAMDADALSTASLVSGRAYDQLSNYARTYFSE